MLIVDSGFSFTHVVPLMEGKIVWNAVKRLVASIPIDQIILCTSQAGRRRQALD
jgi:hypothetical protein